jgi:hypothetical protein
MMEAVSEEDRHSAPPAVRPPSEPVPPPRAPTPESIDPEQVRQFQQFQQFQELMRQQGDLPLLPPAPKKPPWKRILGSRLVRKLTLFLIVVLALYFAYQYYFGNDNENLPASETGGHRFENRPLLQKGPDLAVREVYHRVADGALREGKDAFACAQFSDEAGQRFADHFGATNCTEAVKALTARIGDSWRNAYGSPRFPDEVRNVPTASTRVEISSCQLEFAIDGLPDDLRLGRFTVTKATSNPDDDQWIISGWRSESC